MHSDEYQANNADGIVNDIFSGGITVAEAIERLRTRLLDLSARNRLLNYLHPKGRCIQIADEPNINLVFDRLYVDGKGVPLKYVPDPPPDSYEGKRPDARLFAARLGISTSHEFTQNSTGVDGRRLHGIQTLFFPADLERQLRKLASEAKSAIEETGTNMLFLVFGFLEFYDSEDSERPLLAPLLSLPVALVRGEIDTETRTYRYSVQHNGEDLAENHTLREKLRRDFMLSLPEFGEEDEPEAYFSRIAHAVRNKRRWKVRRQITLGMLAFGKLAIWADLDTKKNADILDHKLINAVFSGGSNNGDGSLHAEDYRIDENPEASHPLIYDADSSQHSAIIDVLAGKNLVINGPPGTGKSQTITNVIASALSKGRKVLFVSEKLAALEVVRHRLNQAGLGHFCLELHSHKTQKKKFLEDIQARIESRFPAPTQLQARLSTLSRQRNELARYAELMGSRLGNALGLTVNEVFWAAERRRQELGDLSSEVNAIGFPDAHKWTDDDIEILRSRLASLGELYDAIGRFDSTHPWWGFRPNPLAPSDDESIARIVNSALEYASSAESAANATVRFFGLNAQPDAVLASKIANVLKAAPLISARVDPSLLPRLFDSEADPKGLQSSRLIADVASGVGKARRLFEVASEVLTEGRRLPIESAEEARRGVGARKLAPGLLTSEISLALEMVSRLEFAVDGFAASAIAANPPYSQITDSSLHSFISSMELPFVAALAQHPIHSLASKSEAVLAVATALGEVLIRLQTIMGRWGIHFDATPEVVAGLANSEGIRGLANGVVVDAPALAEARRLSAFPLAEKPVANLVVMKERLGEETAACAEALERCRLAAERIGLSFDSTDASVAEIVVIASVAASAPANLLDYRLPTLGHVRASELIGAIRAFISAEKIERAAMEPIFYLDALPDAAEIKVAVAALRSKDGIFAFFDSNWRKAKKLHTGLCKERRKIAARQRAEELTRLATWMEANAAFVSNQELKECFGGLFRGLETNADRISLLDEWCRSGRAALVECPGLADKIDLTAIPANRISELAIKASSIKSDAARLAGLEEFVRETLGADVAGFKEAKASGWVAALRSLRKVVEAIGSVSDFFFSKADPSLSPKDALRLMEARAELNEALPDISLLMKGREALLDSGGDELGHIADSRNDPWRDSLLAIKSNATVVAQTASKALSFADCSSPLAAAGTFAKAKYALDLAWAQVSPLPEWKQFEEWQGFSDAAREVASASRGVLEEIGPYCQNGASLSTFFTAFDQEADAKAILEKFSESREVQKVLGELFEGANTNLESLSETHAWGSAVCALELPPAVRRRLLSVDAIFAVNEAKRLYSEIEEGCRRAREAIGSLESYGVLLWDEWQTSVRAFGGRDLPSEIRDRLIVAVGSPDSVLPWSKYLSLRQQVVQDGLMDFVSALEASRVPSAALASAFELAVFLSIGRHIYQSFPELSRFNGTTHEKTRNDYRALDSEIVSITGKDFASQIEKRTRIPEGQRGTTVGDYTEMNLLRREINKQKRHVPIRQLVKRAGRALQELKPCFMMGPLSVAQYLERGALKFDLVVMDEASQLRPEEALGAIARGSQLVVVGDPKQLPPTSFFDRMVEADDDENEDEVPASVSGMESILDICQQLFTPVRCLRWHYRSHHQSLIAFSNHHFYKNLIVFPSPYARNPGLGVKYRHVKGGLYKDRQNAPEAQRVVDAVLEHMLKRPSESLGVVTLNQTQRDLIEELLDKKLKSFAEGDNFMTRWDTEGWPFFVKNLENVQGDERDVIFISTTFGKAPGTDKVRQNFGPISRPDGWRRLNVLFTRSKRRIELFTSMSPEDIVVDERTPLGTKALRDYLDFAKRGVLVSTDEGEREPDSDFELSVANVVTSLGYQVKPQLGVAGFFIDMAVRNPNRPGEFLAGIECDGATYHSGFSVRDRDRIRQEILESLGWKGRIYRIWSTDWFYNPRREIDRLRSFLEERQRVSAIEQPEECSEEQHEDVAENTEENRIAEELAAALSAASEGTDDLFVEVGDFVTYCPIDSPSERHSAHIVDSESNAKMGLVNERTPLAQALLGLSPGDVGVMEIPGQKDRQLRVLKVQRRSATRA